MQEIDFDPYLGPSRGKRGARWVSAAEAVAAIPDRARIFVAAGGQTPMMLCQAVDDARSRWSDIELAMPFLNVRPAFFEHPGEPFRYLTTQASPAFKHLWATGTVNVLASKFSDLLGFSCLTGRCPVTLRW